MLRGENRNNRNIKNINVSLNLPSSSVERAKRGIVSRLWVLLITKGLVLLSDWEELEEARGRRLKQSKTSWTGNSTGARLQVITQQCTNVF